MFTVLLHLSMIKDWTIDFDGAKEKLTWHNLILP